MAFLTRPNQEGLVSQSHIQCGSEGVLPWRSKETVDQSPEESDREEPKRRRIGTLSPSDPTRNTLTFACPYRKHDRRKYCVQNWGPCALTPQKTVARVKLTTASSTICPKLIYYRGHLYKYHQVHECQRCKGLFKSSAELDTHIEAIAGCEARPFMGPCEGITSKVKKRLQCRKKAFPGQSEADRWKDIYQILFPNEELPSPCRFTFDEAIISLGLQSQGHRASQPSLDAPLLTCIQILIQSKITERL